MVDNLTNPLESLIEEIPGVKQIEDVADVLDHLIKGVKLLIGHANIGHAIEAIGAGINHAGDFADIVGRLKDLSWGTLQEYEGGAIFTGLLEGGLGVDMGKVDEMAPGAVKTVDRLIGFCTMLPVVAAGTTALMKAVFGQRASETFGELIGRVPEEIGLSWAIGGMMERALEAALGTGIEEAIMFQKRPTRMEWPALMRLMKQRVISQGDARTYLALQGYPDDLIGAIVQIDKNSLSASQIGSMAAYGIDVPGGADGYMKGLGYSDEDAAVLMQLMTAEKANSAGSIYRGVALTLARQGLITSGQYSGILAETKVPPDEIADSVAAVELETNVGRIAANVGALSKLVKTGRMAGASAVSELLKIGYSEHAANELIESWLLPPTQHGAPTGRILSLLASGAIDSGTAYDKLIENNIRPSDAKFLIDHPTAGGARIHGLSGGLMSTAYVDGVINEGELRSGLKKAGYKDDSIDTIISVAKYRRAHSHRTGDGSKALNEAQVVDGWALGLIGTHDALLELKHLGYDGESATILLEIKNKGKLKSDAPHMTLEQAISFLLSAGYKLIGPPNPEIAEAELIVEGHGYSVIPPIGGSSGPTLDGGGGDGGSPPITTMPIPTGPSEPVPPTTSPPDQPGGGFVPLEPHHRPGEPMLPTHEPTGGEPPPSTSKPRDREPL